METIKCGNETCRRPIPEHQAIYIIHERKVKVKCPWCGDLSVYSFPHYEV